MYYAMYAKDFELEDLIFDHVAPVAYWTSIEEERVLHPLNACKERDEYKETLQNEDDEIMKLYADSNIGNTEYMFVVVPIICKVKSNKLIKLYEKSKILDLPSFDMIAARSEGNEEEYVNKRKQSFADRFNNEYRVVINAIFALNLEVSQEHSLSYHLEFGDKYYQPKAEIPEILKKYDARSFWLRIKKLGLEEWFEKGKEDYHLVDKHFLNASGTMISPHMLLQVDQTEEKCDDASSIETFLTIQNKGKAEKKNSFYWYYGFGAYYDTLILSKKDLASIAIIKKDTITDQMAHIAIR